MIRGVAWVVATTFGLVVGGFVLHFPGSFGGLAAWDLSAALVGAILGFITGVWVGLFQWGALRLPKRSGGRLLLAMGVGIGVTHAVNDGGPNALGLVGASILSGIGMSIGYALLDERRPLALLACFLGWATGLLIAEQVKDARDAVLRDPSGLVGAARDGRARRRARLGARDRRGRVAGAPRSASARCLIDRRACLTVTNGR